MDTRPLGSWSMEALGSVSMRQFLRIALPLAVVFVLAFILLYRVEVSEQATRLLDQEMSAIGRGVHEVERELGIATRDLFFVSDLVTDAVTDPSRLATLERSLLALISRRPGYAQVRFIGPDGRELVRVENSAGRPRIVPTRELQDKSDRSYFIDAVRLEAGEVSISPVDLNVENGRIQEPHLPVLRLATPIVAGGQRRGVVVLNADARRLLDAFGGEADVAGVRHMIVNSDGYWLKYRPDVEWGFLLAHGASFGRTFPEVWEQMIAMGNGRVESSDGVFQFDTVSLQPRASSPTGTAEGPAPNSWLLISLVPRAVDTAIIVSVATPLLVIAVPLLFVLLLLGWLLAGAREGRRLATQALRNAENVRSAMVTAALDAIVVMDAAGHAVEFNPRAQQIFGYTLEEARGKLVADLIIPPENREAHRKGLQRFLETREGPLVNKHVDNLIGMRKDGTEFQVELTICPIWVAEKQFFFGFLRDLSRPGRAEVEAEVEQTG